MLNSLYVFGSIIITSAYMPKIIKFTIMLFLINMINIFNIIQFTVVINLYIFLFFSLIRGHFFVSAGAYL